MTDSSKRQIRVFTLSEDGARAPLTGTGIRVVVAPDVWLEIDFQIDHHVPLSIRVGGRARRAAGADAPLLQLQPYAGSWVTVLAGVGKSPVPPPWDVIVVNQTDLKGDVLDWLRRTSSGDPLGEIAIGDPTRARLPMRKFVVDFDNIAMIHVELKEVADALLGVEVVVRDLARAQRGVRYRSVSMLISPHAANVVSFWLHDGEAVNVG